MSSTKSVLVIRPLRPKDKNGVQDLVTAAFPANPEMRRLVSLDLRNAASNAPSRPEFLVAELKIPGSTGKIVGLTGIMQAFVEWRVYHMFWVNVHPEHQGTGIGTKLVRAGLKILRNQPGALVVEITTHKPNYFRRFGFRPTGHFGRDRCVMMRRKVRR